MRDIIAIYTGKNWYRLGWSGFQIGRFALFFWSSECGWRDLWIGLEFHWDGKLYDFTLIDIDAIRMYFTRCEICNERGCDEDCMNFMRTDDCDNCDRTAWVCENHADRPWDGESGRDDACGCGAGALCPVCHGSGTANEKWYVQIKEQK